MPDTKPVVLSVDDEENVLKSIKRVLRKVDVELLLATSGKEGLELLDAHEVDVIISDMRMPEMSGPEFLKAAADRHPQTRRIVLTGYADADAAQAAINDGGVTRYLSKPWNDTELRQVVEDAAHTAQLERENNYLQTLTADQNEELKRLNDELEERVERRTEALNHTTGVLETTLSELEIAYRQMVDLVANIASMPEPESATSQKKVALALALGEELSLDEVSLTNLGHATRLHRLGWVAIPAAVTATARQDMTPEQQEQFAQHPSYAEAVLLSIPRLQAASEIIGAQYEEFNGAGFPSNRVGEGIPMEARILAVARDYYDAMSGRIFGEKLIPAKAVEHIRNGSETAYDPEIVKIFTRIVNTIEELDVTLDEIQIKSMSLLPGMRLARDLETDDGVILLPKGTTLTETTIETLINLERRSDRELHIFVANDK